MPGSSYSFQFIAESTLPRFHHALVARAVQRGEFDLLRVSAGDFPVGFLYNLRLGAVVHAYQAGMNRAVPDPHAKPGMTSHVLAIREAAAAGHRVYDLMAGDQRYKRSLATEAAPLLWAELVSRRGLAGRALSIWRTGRDRLSSFGNDVTRR
ncbi:GNAT family N-acetyltransferase [Muricoccus radiodurans]|uniref:GNAT family N-acetyltransferase n=1 Tax=Muricoccus radiodurans TaxID=2231721 RepID=UPI003CF810C0